MWKTFFIQPALLPKFRTLLSGPVLVPTETHHHSSGYITPTFPHGDLFHLSDLFTYFITINSICFCVAYSETVMATILSVSAQHFQTTDCAPFVCNLYLWQNISRRTRMSEQISVFNQQIQIKMLPVIFVETFAVKLRQSRNFERAAIKKLQLITPLLFYNHQGPHVDVLKFRCAGTGLRTFPFSAAADLPCRHP